MHMENLSSSDPSHQAGYENSVSKNTQDGPEDGSRWYFSRKEIEEYSPSKQDGIDLKKETYFRKSYCSFLQDLGIRLKVPQVTIATAIIFCHRFFLRQSHAKNDRRTIATVCMFLAGKVEETPRPLKDVILVSYEIINKKDPAASQRIKQKEVYERQKELILLGERVVLATLAFDLNVLHPYKPLVEAIKKFKVAQNALAQVAWNFVNDGLRTSLCLQFKPHHIAAGAIFLAAKFLKVKLPSDGEKVWWQEFDVTPRQLEEVSNQMLELYEQNRLPPSGEADGSIGGGTTNRTLTKAHTNSEERTVTDNLSLAEGDHSEPLRAMPNQSIESTSMDIRSPSNQKTGNESKLRQEMEPSAFHDKGKGQNSLKHQSEPEVLVEQAKGSEMKINESREAAEQKDKHTSQNIDFREGAIGKSQEVIKKIDKDKVKAALEKRRKSLGSITQKTELMDEDDLIERELEAGIEIAAGSEKNRQEQRQSWIKSSNNKEHEDSHQEKLRGDDRDEHHQQTGQSSNDIVSSNMEEGEFSTADDIGFEYQSPKSNSSKRKAGSSQDNLFEGKQRRVNAAGPLPENHITENHV